MSTSINRRDIVREARSRRACRADRSAAAAFLFVRGLALVVLLFLAGVALL
ncbi:hypothetical protein RB614_10865 [Phytohabitans sp. ZYX-F-186]|uniref:Uncharacterized protein n=1 Tax=Phytohabitans maris TaxID=3071409 RepID=A0ABU0ZDA3_9ACTN|nr:hypothetical protein [Phytohabitans sp. ZYX-F-186]MDQ7905023.1 hypothetical protein [Phytohabitans sp. ZYX-F-186]